MGTDGRPSTAWKWARNGSKKAGSSSRRSTASNSAGIPRHISGRIASHSVGCGFTVLNMVASIRTSPTGRGHHP